MKIKKPNAGALTNCELLDFLKSRGASKDSSRVIAPVAPSEYKVYDFLVGTPASSQTREQVSEFLDKCKPYRLAKAEILNIINLAPHELVEIVPIIEESEMRLGDQIEDLLDLVRQIFPRPPAEVTPEAGMNDDKEETGNEEQNEVGVDIDVEQNEIVDGEPMEIS